MVSWTTMVAMKPEKWLDYEHVFEGRVNRVSDRGSYFSCLVIYCDV